MYPTALERYQKDCPLHHMGSCKLHGSKPLMSCSLSTCPLYYWANALVEIHEDCHPHDDL